MADYLDAKGPDETVERRWASPVEASDGAASVDIVASGVTATAELNEDDEVVLTISGGTAGQTAYIDVTVTSNAGFILADRLYLPILATTAGTTVQDIVSFALRKVVGLGETPDAEQAEDAREKLSDMLEEWRVTGADVGAPSPLELATVIYSPASHISAIKNNLIVRLADQYGPELITPGVATAAVRGLQLVKSSKRPFAEAEYF